jgi:hypothetical protein
MIPLTPQLQQALDANLSPPLRLLDPRTNIEYVVVRAEFYEMARGLMEPFNRAGWDDPALDIYEEHLDEK